METEFFGVDDVNNAEKGSLQTLHFSDSLWQHSTDQAPVSGLTEQVEHLLSLIDDPIWRFWSTWYKGFLNGKPLDGQLLSEITWIDDAIWNAGPEAVATEIERIQARLALQDEIAELRDEVLKLRQNQATPATGHNQGPPIDDSEIHLRDSFDLVWPILDALEEEAAQHSPDISRLKALALRLWEIAKTAATYCGAKLDIALDKAAETVGETGTKWAIRASVATYASTNEGVQSVAKLAWKFAKTLSGS